MIRVINPQRSDWAGLLRRPVIDFKDVRNAVLPVIEAVRRDGDRALRDYSRKFDGVAPGILKADPASLQSAESELDSRLKSAIQLARDNIETFHRAQLERFEPLETMPGVRCWRRSVAIENVGLYVPGGTAPLFSTLLMLAIPARIAGCQRIVVCTPPSADGVHAAIRYTAHLLQIHDLFQVGGAQAVAAMAFGTASVPTVDKIFGPGNQYVTAAKQLVSLEGTAIDLPAGPTELAIIADRSCTPEFVAADVLSQAEHGIDSQVVLVSDDETVLDRVLDALAVQLADLPRRDIATVALSSSPCVLLSSLEQALELVNMYAPEHLILATAEPEALAAGVRNAGSVFLGHHSPESAGDYATGTNHTLPTNGAARAFSGVSLDSFVRKITFQQISADGLRLLGPAVAEMAAAEQLTGHQRAITRRLAALGG